MEIPYPTDDLPATPEYVLAVLRDMHRLLSGLRPLDSKVVLDFDTTVADWLWATDLDEVWPLESAMNDLLGLRVSRREWRAALHPARRRTLADVCRVGASHMTIPRPRPFVALGAESLPAGIFLTIRSALHEAGADVSNLRPSSPLDGYASRHVSELIRLSSRMAPGAMPTPKRSGELEVPGCSGPLHGLACFVSGALGSTPWLMITGVALSGLWFAGVVSCARRYDMAPLDFGGLETFGDLAEALARQTAA